MTKPTQFLTNKEGEKVAVVISIDEYKKLCDQLEESDEIRAFDEAEASKETAVPFVRTNPESHLPKRTTKFLSSARQERAGCAALETVPRR
jgi:predicted DNA-binding antitoxin AbrB/MazE fold protein